MKKLIALLLVLTMAVCLVACGEDKKTENNPTTPVETPTHTDESKPQATTKPEETKDPNLTTYTVKVVDEAGNPITSGCVVQICTDSGCNPCFTPVDGVSTWNVVKADYQVKFAAAPAGFQVEPVYYFEAGATEMTIVLKAAA